MAILALLLVLSQYQTLSSEEIVAQLQVAQLIEQKEPERAFRIRSNAVHSALQIPVERRADTLNRALLAELVQSSAHLKSGQRLFRGEAEGEYHLFILEAVTDWKDQAVIPALVDCLENAGRVSHALADFGDYAFQPLYRIGAGAEEGDVFGALLTLELMLEKSTINQANKKLLEYLADSKLAMASDFAILTAAATLAVATGNPILRTKVLELVANRQKLVQLGLTHENEQNFFLRITAEALAKKP